MLARPDPAHAALARQEVAPRPLLRFEKVSVAAGATNLLDAVDLTVPPGLPTILLGPNGAGKTTLLRLAMGLLAPTTGRVVAPSPLRRAIMFQKPVMLRRSAAANVAYALDAAGQGSDEDAVLHLLRRVRLDGLASRPARRLSGGEQQRLALARALASAPDLLLLDEPTASLDPAQTKAVEEIIAAVAATGVKILMATHDLGQARRLGGDIVLLVNGRLVEQAPVSRFFAAPASEAARRFIAGDLVL